MKKTLSTASGTTTTLLAVTPPAMKMSLWKLRRRHVSTFDVEGGGRLRCTHTQRHRDTGIHTQRHRDTGIHTHRHRDTGTHRRRCTAYLVGTHTSSMPFMRSDHPDGSRSVWEPFNSHHTSSHDADEQYDRRETDKATHVNTDRRRTGEHTGNKSNERRGDRAT